MKRLVLGVAVVGVAGFAVIAGRAGGAHAQETRPGFNECIAVSLYATSGRDFNAGNLPDKTVKIPAGWTVVGGTVVGAGTSTSPGMVLCR
ncbi:MAG TPA: hypothetical protein DFS52_02985 [Myxococcales bacterium]|nr:hypothetical protein [Myxococcales bacterium]